MCLFYRPCMVDALNKRHKLYLKKDTSYVFFIDHIWSMLSINARTANEQKGEEIIRLRNWRTQDTVGWFGEG